jgi:dephospho-CoA kinase
MITLGITGTIGAGKGTIVEYLKTKGFKHYAVRDYLLKELERRGLEPVRDNIRLVANELRKTHSPSYIIGELLNEAKNHNEPAIVESIRALGEVDFLRAEAGNFFLISIDADLKHRYERIVKRGSSTDHLSFETFVVEENRELNAKEPWDMNIRGCMAQADCKLFNNGDVNALHIKIDEILAQIKP